MHQNLVPKIYKRPPAVSLNAEFRIYHHDEGRKMKNSNPYNFQSEFAKMKIFFAELEQ